MENSKKKCIKNIVAILLLLIIASCNSQNSKKKIIINEEEMEQTKKETHNVFKDYQPARQFNINEFNLKSRGENKCRFVDGNGVEVYQFTNPEFPSGKINKYWENRNYPNSGYEFVCSYDANGLLLHSLTTFYNIEFGVIQYYDSSGNVTNKKDLDAPYKFSLDDLIDKMKDEYEIDISNTELTDDVSRGFVDKINLPVYEVRLKDLLTPAMVHIYLINGNTGETMLITSRETMWNGQPSERVLDEYIRKKANGEL